MEDSEKINVIRITKNQLMEFGIDSSFDTRVYYHPIKFIGNIFWYRFKKMLEMAEPRKDSVALDFGCGHGLFLPTLSRYYKKVIGIDIKTYPQTKKILRHFNCSNVKVRRMDGNKVKFARNTFDVVFCADTLEHFKNLDIPLRNIRRILKPHGKLIVNSPLETNFFKTMRFISGYNKPSDHYHGASEIYEKIGEFFKIEERYNYPSIFGKFRLLEIVKASKA